MENEYKDPGKEETMEEAVERLLEEPYWIVDLLPEQVPADSPGSYFRVEEYYRQGKRFKELKSRYADMLLKLCCYYDVRMMTASREEPLKDPSPAGIAAGAEKERWMNLLFPAEDALITLNREDLYMTVYHPSDNLLATVQKLANAAGLFLWQPNTSA